MKLLFCQTILLFPLLCSSQDIKDPVVLDSLFNSDCKSTFVRSEKVVNIDYVKYYIASFSNTKYCLNDVKTMMTSYDNYSNIFRYLDDFRCINSAQQEDFIGTFYFEMSFFPFKMWCLFDFYNMDLKDTNLICLQAIQNSDVKLNNQYKPKTDKWNVIETKDFEFKLMAKKDLPYSSRLSFTGSTIPLKKIPPSLYKIGLWIVFPQFIRDIEKKLKNKKNSRCRI